MSGIKEMGTPAPAPGYNSTYNTNVVVNLEVQVDTCGNLVIFGKDASGVSNVIVADYNISRKAFYDASCSSLIEFWEPSGNMGTFLADLSGRDGNTAASQGNDYTPFVSKLAIEFQKMVNGGFDCSGADPFNLYAAVEQYYKHTGFGRLALSAYAHYIFGHPAATAAITNDADFIAKMNAGPTSLSGIALPALGYWTETDFAGTGEAHIAELLVGKIIQKDPTAILAIAEQVLGQDASRAMDEDNNALEPNERQGLKFIAGDVIYVRVKLAAPGISFSSTPGQKIQASDLLAKYNASTEDITYTIKITLSDNEVSATSTTVLV